MESNIREAIAAVRAGEKNRAFRLLREIIETNPDSEEAELAWIWMSTVVDNPERKRQALEAALRLNPNNQTAQLGLTKLGQLSPPHEAGLESSWPPALQSEPVARETVTEPSPAVEGDALETTTSWHLIPLPAITWVQLLGLAGAFLLALGVFLPIVRIPIAGSQNYFQNGQGDGVFIILLALVVIGFVIMRRNNWLWLPGMLSLALVGFTLSSLVVLIREIRQSVTAEMEDSLFGGLATLFLESIQIEWGWIALVTGALLILGAAYLGRHDNWRRYLAASLMISVGVVLVLWILRANGLVDAFAISAPEWDGQTPTSVRAVEVPVGEPANYEAGALRVLEVHVPAAFYITSSSSFGREAAEPVQGTEFAAVELEFRCSESTEVVCDTVPEASLELLLADGRQVDDDWAIHDAPELGYEDVSGGATTTGWRVFRVPEDVELSALVVEPFSGEEVFHVQLPTPRDGFAVAHPPMVLDSGGSSRLIPGLRQALSSAGVQAPIVARFENDSGSGVGIDMCAETTFYFDEDEALEENRRALLDVAEVAVEYLEGGDYLVVIMSDCSSISSLSSATFILDYQDLNRWRRREYTDQQLLHRVLISLD